MTSKNDKHNNYHHEKVCIYSYSVHVENMLCMLDSLSFISYALINKSDSYLHHMHIT